ncbi:nucleic acid-binding protein [Myriangium duriaei CBS 260.36]|uniref:Nucleic acid-binding protein n=1 Tax=Myriangium duriaei CBS 260.36 TaxID=1168546 RepID=A0A9P4MM29_9PEZI|nr:nucleic acid-binding protein [Myriangium duriaei CBS 260.36]
MLLAFTRSEVLASLLYSKWSLAVRPSTSVSKTWVLDSGAHPTTPHTEIGRGYGDYSTTSYGAQGGADGGGFMPGSQESPNAKRGGGRYGNNTLRPVTIKQIHAAELPDPDADAYMLDNSECTQITFVGQIMNISQQTTNVTYKLDDGTGQIEVKVWVDPERIDVEDPNSMLGRLRENAYARCWGKIKSFGKRHVVAHVARPVTDMNEVNYHLLEATAVHLQLTRGAPGEKKGGAGADGYGQANGASYGGGGADKLGNVSSGAKKVYQCIQNTPQTNEGLHMQDIAMRTSMEVSDVLKAGDELQGMGLIYTTVDDHTWAVLEM